MAIRDFRFAGAIFVVLFQVLVFGFALAINSCADQELTQEELLLSKQYNVLIDRENWALCAAIYDRAGVPTVHLNHHHRRGRITQPGWVRNDLLVNQCHYLLREYWIPRE